MNAIINMAGVELPGLVVTEYAEGHGRRAHWWVLCLRCHEQRPERGTNIRKALRGGDYRIVCRRCEG